MQAGLPPTRPEGPGNKVVIREKKIIIPTYDPTPRILNGDWKKFLWHCA